MMDIQLRNWQLADVGALQALADNKKIADNLRDGFVHPYTLKDAEDYIQSCIQADERRAGPCAIIVDGVLAGSIGVFYGGDVYRKRAEIGYWLGEPFLGRGIITQAITMICQKVFDDGDIIRIYAEPFAPNIGSRRALEKAGFILEGIKKRSVYKNGQLLDSCIYALLKE